MSGFAGALPLGTRTVVAGDFNARRTDATARHVADAFAPYTELSWTGNAAEAGGACALS